MRKNALLPLVFEPMRVRGIQRNSSLLISENKELNYIYGGGARYGVVVFYFFVI